MSDENLLDFTPCSKYTPSTINTEKELLRTAIWAEKIPGRVACALTSNFRDYNNLYNKFSIFQVNLECIFTQKTGEVKRITLDLSCART